jgi:hypothetical protein
MRKLSLLFMLVLTFNFAQAQSDIILNADNCLGEQDLNALEVDVTNCPALPSSPQPAAMGDTDVQVELGAWELGKTVDGENYKYGSLTNGTPRVLEFDGGSSEVNQLNLTCWAKGYYRLRKLLKNPPADYITLREAGYQVRFFQFQTDLRNGRTGFLQISSYMDHLVKWVTVITEDGVCIEPTLEMFETYLAKEIQRRGL